MKRTIYIETSVISYYTAKPSDNIRINGHQLATYEFWEILPQYNVYISDTVIEESSRGDEEKVQERLFAIRKFSILEIDSKTQELAKKLVNTGTIPEKCPEDALHISVAATYSIGFVLTWNFKHINNPFMMRNITDVVTNAGYQMPIICSPEEFLEAEHE
ncbi:MAG: PIN domain-containing protein [Verrucomicrobiae bacterium]|nr:PIN domain-containing protein [Verrucomicrobiae bacterium]